MAMRKGGGYKPKPENRKKPGKPTPSPFKGLRHDALHPGTDELPKGFDIPEIDRIRNETIYVPTADGLAKMTFGEYLKWRKNCQ